MWPMWCLDGSVLLGMKYEMCIRDSAKPEQWTNKGQALRAQGGCLCTCLLYTSDNHLMLVDLAAMGKTGKEVESLLDSVNITANKNTIPNDPQSPFLTSGVRLGTPAVTARGMNCLLYTSRCV